MLRRPSFRPAACALLQLCLATHFIQRCATRYEDIRTYQQICAINHESYVNQQEEQRRAGNQTHHKLDIDVAVALAHVNSIVYCELPNVAAWNCSR